LRACNLPSAVRVAVMSSDAARLEAPCSLLVSYESPLQLQLSKESEFMQQLEQKDEEIKVTHTAAHMHQPSADRCLPGFRPSAAHPLLLLSALLRVDFQIEALKVLINNVAGGEQYPRLLMSVMKFCLHSENHLVKKLLLAYWEVVDKKDKNGVLLHEMILVCNAMKNNLTHANEYIRGSTLRSDSQTDMAARGLVCAGSRCVGRLQNTSCFLIFSPFSMCFPFFFSP